jgi:hypothetical protein
MCEALSSNFSTTKNKYIKTKYQGSKCIEGVMADTYSYGLGEENV